MILQLNPTLEVHTPLGDGEAILVIDYGLNVNTVWLVRFAGGVIKHFYSDDIRLWGNPMKGKGWDVERINEITTKIPPKKESKSLIEKVDELIEKVNTLNKPLTNY